MNILNNVSNTLPRVHRTNYGGANGLINSLVEKYVSSCVLSGVHLDEAHRLYAQAAAPVPSFPLMAGSRRRSQLLPHTKQD